MANILTLGYKCAIPVFDGLLPEPHNRAILRLLFTCAYWHGLAKLRMHTDDTLNILDQTTISIGTEFRAFVNKTCPCFNTQELKREAAARRRRQVQKKAETQSASESNHLKRSPMEKALMEGSQRNKKQFNLRSYKYHSLGDVASTIRQYGTTDSYSTEPVRNNHCYSYYL
jgi:hypothetical protein